MMEKYIFEKPQPGTTGSKNQSTGFAMLVGMIDPEKFEDLYFSSQRKLRNMLEGMYHKKIRKGSGRKVSLNKTKNRTETALAVQQGILMNIDEYMSEELLKAWLYSKREMLKTSLDFFKIENEDGLTEKDLDAFEKAEIAKLDELVDALLKIEFKIEDIAIYFQFMHIEKALEVERIKQVFAGWGTLPEEEDEEAETESGE